MPRPEARVETELDVEALEMRDETAVVMPLTGSLSTEDPVRPRAGVTAQQAVAPWGSFALKVGLSVAVFLMFTLLVEAFADKQVKAISARLMDCIGLPGLFLMVFLADGVPQPFTYVPLIFMAVKASVRKPVVFAVCALASYSAALAGYWVGFHLRGFPWGGAFFDRLAEEHPYVPELMQRRGAVGVGLAALLPVPLALATWTAGSFRVHFPHFLVAGMCRVPKIAVFVALS